MRQKTPNFVNFFSGYFPIPLDSFRNLCYTILCMIMYYGVLWLFSFQRGSYAPHATVYLPPGGGVLIREHYPQAEVLMGTSTAGIAHAAITATILDLPMGYVRSGAKDHGRGNQIEGKLLPGQKVVVVEDLISTGGSCIEVVNVLREAGADVLGVVSIFTYGMKKGLERLAAAEVKNISLCDLDTLVEVAAEKAYIAPEDKERLIKFRNNPSDESWMA